MNNNKKNMMINRIFSESNKLRDAGKQINKFFHSNNEDLCLLENDDFVKVEVLKFWIPQKRFLIKLISMREKGRERETLVFSYWSW